MAQQNNPIRKLVEDQNVEDVLLWSNVTQGPKAPKDAAKVNPLQAKYDVAATVNPFPPQPDSLFPKPRPQGVPAANGYTHPAARAQAAAIGETSQDDKFTMLQLLALLSVYMPPESYNSNPIIAHVREKVKARS